MKNISRLSLFVLLSLLLAACSNSTGPKQRFTPYTEENALLGLTNTFRAQAQTCGNQQFPAAPALTWVEAVGDAAWFHSIDMARADTENHVGGSAVERMKARGFDTDVAAENRKKTALPGNPQDAFNAWTANAEACANIMNPSFTNMGAGYGGHYDNITTGAYWTQILTAPKGTVAPGLTVTPTTALVAVGSAPIQFKSSTNQVTWEMTGGVGTFAWAGDTFTYVPPATGVGGTDTITVRSGNLSATATVTVVSLNVAPRTLLAAVGGPAIPFSATLTSSTATINWSLTGPGSISATTGASTNYTPPTTGGAGTATLTASVGTVTASATITINAANPDALQVQVKDLQRQAFVPPFGPGSLGRHLTDQPVAPMAASPNGGAFMLWIRDTDKKAFLTQLDGSGNAVGADQDLGSAQIAGAVGTDGTKVAYLLRTTENQLLFKVMGGGETLLVNNEQPAPWPGGNVFGNEKMFKPVDFRRQAVVPVGANWFTSFDHNNRFPAGDFHTGMSMVMLDGNGTNPKLGVPWGTSHSLDILALFDGTNIINVTVGDGFPQDFRLHVLTPEGQPLPIGAENRVDLFAKNKFNVDGQVIDNVPGNGGGLSSGKLGGLSDIGGGKFALSYLIQPSDGLAAKINEIGVLVFDKTGTAQRIKIKDGTGINYVRSARYGTNILVAWEAADGKVMATVISPQGTVVKAEQELVGGASLNDRDSFINLSNGDIMWTAATGGSLKVFRLPTP